MFDMWTSCERTSFRAIETTINGNGGGDGNVCGAGSNQQETLADIEHISTIAGSLLSIISISQTQPRYGTNDAGYDTEHTSLNSDFDEAELRRELLRDKWKMLFDMFDPEGFGEITVDEFINALKSPEFISQVPMSKRELLLERTKKAKLPIGPGYITFQDFVNVFHTWLIFERTMPPRMRIRESQSIYNDKLKIWQGVRRKHNYGSQDSIGAAVLMSLLNDPDHITQICYPTGKEYSNQEIAQLSIRVALNFEKLGVQQCEIVGLCASNSDFLAPLVFGAMLAGLTVSTLDPSFDKEGIRHAYSITRPKLMFCDGNIYNNVKAALETCNLASTPIYTVNNHIEGVATMMTFFDDIGQGRAFNAPALKEGSDQVAMILCSSGTTGLPKGVTMSHASILNAVEFNMLPTDRYLCFSTLYWLTGLLTLIHGTINGITRIISNRAYSPDDFFDIVERYRANIILGPPSQIAMSLTADRIGKCDLSSIELYLVGGSAVSCVLIENFKKYAHNARFIVGYGMSETCGFVSYGEMDSNNSVGQLNVNVDVKIIDINGKYLSANEIGEICIRTIYPWTGYFRNPDATKAIYDQNQWIHSGDIGYFDDSGNLYVVDRIKDIMKYKNFHFYPTEIEKAIQEISDVVEVCVFGIPDVIATHLPAAAVVKHTNSSLTEDEIYQHVVDRRQHFEHLRGGIYFLENLPRTASGKTLRPKVMEICENIRKLNLFGSDGKD